MRAMEMAFSLMCLPFESNKLKSHIRGPEKLSRESVVMGGGIPLLSTLYRIVGRG